MECKVTQIIELDDRKGEQIDGWLVLGEVIAVHIDKSLIKDGIHQTALARPILLPEETIWSSRKTDCSRWRNHRIPMSLCFGDREPVRYSIR